MPLIIQKLQWKQEIAESHVLHNLGGHVRKYRIGETMGIHKDFGSGMTTVGV